MIPILRAVPATIFLKAENENGITKILGELASEYGVTFDISDVLGDKIKLYIWENNLRPVTRAFER